MFEIHDVLLVEWKRVLKPGGRLWVETPDFLSSCKKFIEADKDGKWDLYGHFFSEAWNPGQIHKFLFTEEQLIDTFKYAGFINTARIQPTSTHVTIGKKDPNIFLAMETFKPL